jgi:preprotein translocase subunit SecA
VDNQLRGRSGRQGDPGSSRFYLSLEDSLLRIFAGDRVARIMDMLKMPEGEAIMHPMVSRSIENAQRKVEARNFDIRKQLLEYDDVANEQRKVIYRERNELLDAADEGSMVTAMRHGLIQDLVLAHMPPGSMEEQWDLPGLQRSLEADLNLHEAVAEWVAADQELDQDRIITRLIEASDAAYAAKVELAGAEVMQQFERAVMLQVLDQHWREHLSALDHLRQGIHLRGYAQKNPKQEYKREAFELFSAMLDSIKREVCRIVVMVQVRSQDDVEAVEQAELENVQYQHAEFDDAEVVEAQLPEAAAPLVNAGDHVGRNDPCPCGSGKKYKHCHGKLA